VVSEAGKLRILGFQIDIQIWARVLPFALYMVFLAIEAALASLLPGVDLRWVYAVKIAAVLAALWYYRHIYHELLAVPERFWVWLAAPLVGILVFVLWINLDAGWMSIGGGPGFDPRDPEGDFIWPLILVRLFGAAVIVPVMEELFWRSFLLRWIQQQNFLELSPLRIGLRAILISSVLFGLEHSLWLAGIVAGLAYAWLYRVSGNIWVPIVSHAVTNLALGLWVLHSAQWQFW